MRKKTAPKALKHRAASPGRQPGLIAKGNNTKRSETDKCVLDNRSHRTCYDSKRTDLFGGTTSVHELPALAHVISHLSLLILRFPSRFPLGVHTHAINMLAQWLKPRGLFLVEVSYGRY